MGILASVMPGVRAVRAPLAAGFLLLLSAWIALESSVPKHPTEGVWASLERLEPLVSAIGILGLVAFAAYVVGSLYLVAVVNLRRTRRGSGLGIELPFSKLDAEIRKRRDD